MFNTVSGKPTIKTSLLHRVAKLMEKIRGLFQRDDYVFMKEDLIVPMPEVVNPRAPVTMFMCLTDYEHEMGFSSDASKLFASEKSLRRHNKCADSCGIVEVEVTFSRLIAPATIPSYEGERA